MSGGIDSPDVRRRPFLLFLLLFFLLVLLLRTREKKQVLTSSTREDYSLQREKALGDAEKKKEGGLSRSGEVSASCVFSSSKSSFRPACLEL